jgi:hypothetical protein
LVLVLAVLMVSYASSMRAYLEQREHMADLRASIEQSQANIADLEREQRRWHDPAFVQAQATQRFGWVMPGEIGFQVIDEDGLPLGHTDSLSDPAELAAEDRRVWWQDAWGSMEAAGNPEDVPDPVEEIHAPKKKER